MDGQIITCVFCGQEYPIGTPTHGSEILTEHIKVCERHPLRKAESDVAMLRAALAGLIGADSEQELRQMETTMRLLPAPDADKAVSINAIHALLATMTPNAIAHRPVEAEGRNGSGEATGSAAGDSGKG